MFFAAKEAVEKRARAKGKAEGKAEGKVEGRKEERERIQRELAAQGMPLTPEQVAVLTRESE